MKIKNLLVQNFRAIRRLEFSNLQNIIVIAGPNGCGKSSIFDALRLLKSNYGQYHDAEFQSWFNMYQINQDHISSEIRKLFNDKSKEIVIKAEVKLSSHEKTFLRSDGLNLVRQSLLNRVRLRSKGPLGQTQLILPKDYQQLEASVQDEVEQKTLVLNEELLRDTLSAQATITAGGRIQIIESIALEIVFGMYIPQNIGVIDYHGQNRSYGRESVNSVNLRVSDTVQRSSQNALYDNSQKYTNIKTEMTSAYVKELIAQAAGVVTDIDNTLLKTLQELFALFFPGKKFPGPKPTADGSILFPVELKDGQAHDIDELSSGEKEVLLGYLRLRNSAPKQSVILLDEPELHLNPRLIRALPRFYQKNIGEAFGNQLWMITHSDDLLREAVEEPNIAVYHMQPQSDIKAGENQVHIISAAVEVERAIIDLVGDLATYSPRAKVVILEGGGDSNVDQNIISKLFPNFAERVNLVSGGSKSRVRELHSLLDSAYKNENLRTQFFSIVDRDFDGPITGASERRYSWNVYHIENYLIVPKYIRQVVEALNIGTPVPNEDQIILSLRECENETINELVRIKLESLVFTTLRDKIKIGVNPTSKNLAFEFRTAAERSLHRIRDAVETDLTISMWENEESTIRSKLSQTFANDTWLMEFRGRDVLKRFCGKIGLEIPYSSFRNLIVNRMQLDNFKPEGMREIVDGILSI